MAKTPHQKPQKQKNNKKLNKGFNPLNAILQKNQPLQWLHIVKTRMEERKITPKDLAAKNVISEESIQRILNNEHASNRRIQTWHSFIYRLRIKRIFKSSTEILDWLLLDPVFSDLDQCIALSVNSSDAKHTSIIKPANSAKNKGWWVRYPNRLVTKNFLARITIQNNFLLSIKSVIFLQVNPTFKALIYHGIPGCGKTTLFQHICTDENLRRIFVDGIFWVKDVLRSEREALISLGTQINSDEAGYNFKTPVFVETWEEWIAKEDRRALIIIDNPETEILETILRIHTKRIQFVILTTDHHTAFRTASAFFQRDEIMLEQIGSLDIEDAVIDWMQQKISDETLPSSVRKGLQENAQEILEWCNRVSYLPGIVRFILETYLQKAWGYSDIMLTPETIGLKEIATKILEPIPTSDVVLLEQILNKIRYGYFTLGQAQKISQREKDLQDLLHSWKLRGFLISNIRGPNEKETYQFLSILVESADLANKQKESLQDWINLYRIKKVKNDLDEIEAKQAALQKN